MIAPTQRRRRVLVLCTDLGVRVPGDKGASLHLRAVTRAFASLGHDVLLVGVAGHGDPDLRVDHATDTSAGAGPFGRIETVLLPHPGRAEGLERERRKRAFVAGLDAAAGDTIRRFAPDLVYERLSLFGDAGVSLAADLGVPHVLEVNSLLAEEERRWRDLVSHDLATALERRVLTAADLRVAVSAEVAAAIAAATAMVPAGDVGPTIVVPNGVEVERFRSLPDRHTAREVLQLPTDATIAAFVGTLRPWHGLEVAVETLPAVAGLRLVVAGDGPVRAPLAARAAELGVADRIHWLGHVAHSDVPTVLAAADVALAPYAQTEGFAFSPLKLLEYLAAGVPVVASDVGQIRSLLDGGRLGRLVAPGDTAALATALREIASDGEPWRRRARIARSETLRDASWEGRIAAVLDALDAVDERTAPVSTGRGPLDLHPLTHDERNTDALAG